MNVDAYWAKPVQLKRAKSPGMIYEVDLSALPAEPGVYVFYRQHGRNLWPIYIGETVSIRSRIKSHLNSLQLMRAIENASSGKRFLIYCTVGAGSREKAKKQVKVVEKALILHAQGEGFELFNTKGTKLPTDTISFTGNRSSEALAPRKMLVKRALVRSK